MPNPNVITRIQTSSPESKRHRPNRVLRLPPTPHVAHQLGPETASLRFWQGHLKQWQYCAPNPRDDMNRPHRNWHANHPAKPPGRPVEGPACPLGRSTSVDQHARSARTNVARTVHSLAQSQPCWPQRREDMNSPSVENPPLPARTEGTSPWINPCTFHEQRTCLLLSTFHTVRAVPPLRTWPALAFTRLR